MPASHYQKPDWMTKHVMNPLLSGLTALGLGLRGMHILTVRGRKTGKAFGTPVNPLVLESGRYLVAPRGETGWVRNIRVSGEGELRLGRKRERIRVVELSDAEKPPLLREYLKRWKMETGKFFDGVSDESPDDELRRIAPRHPVFRIIDAP
ncbi:MAG: nitroreductase/quinone reductase family protein [Dehalococcoidia bacterium]